MTKDELVQQVKHAIGLVKSGDVDGSYDAYRTLFANPSFAVQRPEDQRQALKLMILAKHAPSRPTPAMVEAHRAAVPVLTEMVSAHGDPADHELLGICHVCLGNEESASAIFRAGLAIERQRNPQSDLCGALMKRVSLL